MTALITGDPKREEMAAKLAAAAIGARTCQRSLPSLL